MYLCHPKAEVIMKVRILLSLVVLALIASTAGAGPVTEKIVLIAHKSLKLPQVSASQVADLYTLQTKEIAGQKVKLFDYAEDNDAKNILCSYIGKSSTELRKLWLKTKLSGAGSPPTTVTTPEEMVEKVSSTPGAIGFVSASKAGSNVTVIATLN